MPANGNGTRGIQFDGNDYLRHVMSKGGASLPAAAGLVGLNPTRSIEVWVYNPSIGGEETMVSIGKRGGPSGSNCSFGYGSIEAWGALDGWGNPDIGWSPQGPPLAGQWHHLVYTYDGTTTRVYADGALANSEVLGSGAVNTHSGTPIQLGAQLESNGTTVTPEHRGSLTLARIRIHDGVLTGAQVLNNYNAEKGDFENPTGEGSIPSPIHRWSFNNPPSMDAAGSIIEDLVGSADGIVINGSGTATSTGSRLALSGGSLNVAPYVDLPNGLLSSQSADNGGSGQVTIEGWVRITGNQGTSRIFDFGSTTTGELTGPGGTGAQGLDYLVLSAEFMGDVNVRRVEVRNDDGASAGRDIFDYGTFTFNTDLHFALTWDEANGFIKAYENGLEVGTLFTDKRMSAINDVNNWLGRSNWPDNNMQGEFDEFRIYPFVLDPEPILLSYEAGPDGEPWMTEEPLVMHGVNNGDGTITLSWTGGMAPFTVQESLDVSSDTWGNLLTTHDRSVRIPVLETNAFWRLMNGTAPTGEISGLLKDGTGEPLANQMIRVQGTGQSTVTDNEGAFNLGGVIAGLASLVFEQDVLVLDEEGGEVEVVKEEIVVEIDVPPGGVARLALTIVVVKVVVRPPPPCDCNPWCGIVGGTFNGIQKVVAGGGKHGNCADPPHVVITGPGAFVDVLQPIRRTFAPAGNGTWTVRSEICNKTQTAEITLP